MATAYVDHISNIAAVEEDGVIKSLTRAAFIDGLDTVSDAGDLVEQMLAAEGLPPVNHGMTINGSVVVLRRRNPSYNDGKPMVALEYDSGTSETPGSSTKGKKRGRASLHKLEVYKDRDGNQVKVSFNGDEQAGKLTVLIPVAQPDYETVENTSDPEGLLTSKLGRVNSNTWKGFPAGRWMLMEGEYEQITGDYYRFRWRPELTDESEGWLPLAIYIDKATGKPPLGISGTDGSNGVKKVPYYTELDFSFLDN